VNSFKVINANNRPNNNMLLLLHLGYIFRYKTLLSKKKRNKAIRNVSHNTG